MANREDVIRDFLKEGHGYDAEPRMVDGTGRVQTVTDSLSTLMIQLSIPSAASLSVELFRAQQSGAATLPTQIAAPTGESYRDIVRYLMANPSQIRNVNISTSENPANGAPILAGMKILPKRQTPFGLSCANEILVQNSQTSQDYRPNMTQVPFVFDLDGFNFLEISSAATNGTGAAVLVTLAFQIGNRSEVRARLPAGVAPVAIRPGGLGVVPVL